MENIQKADEWADGVIKCQLSHIYQGFGGVQLMVGSLGCEIACGYWAHYRYPNP